MVMPPQIQRPMHKTFPSRSGPPLASGLLSEEFAPDAAGSNLERCTECGRPTPSAAVCAALDRIAARLYGHRGIFIERSQPKENL